MCLSRKNTHYLAALFLCALFWHAPVCADLMTAVSLQKKALSSASHEEQQHLYNEALSIYLPYTKTNPSGYLLANIGAIYLDLHDYGQAIAFLRQALALEPRDTSIFELVQQATKQAELQNQDSSSVITHTLGFRWWSPPERRLTIIIGFLCSFVLFSIHIWRPRRWNDLLWKSTCILFCLIICCLSGYALFIPDQAVALRAAPVRTKSLDDSESVPDTVAPGELVDILEYNHKTETLLIRTLDGSTGYLLPKDMYFLSP